MSIASWKKEFTPTTAKQAAKCGVVAAAEHSLRRWKGFRKKNLDKHGFEWVMYEIVWKESDEVMGPFVINEELCALCIFSGDIEGDVQCYRCPLYKVRDETPCGESIPKEFKNPVSSYVLEGDPEFMIKWLEKAVKYAKKHEKVK